MALSPLAAWATSLETSGLIPTPQVYLPTQQGEHWRLTPLMEFHKTGTGFHSLLEVHEHFESSSSLETLAQHKSCHVCFCLTHMGPSVSFPLSPSPLGCLQHLQTHFTSLRQKPLLPHEDHIPSPRPPRLRTSPQVPPECPSLALQ